MKKCCLRGVSKTIVSLKFGGESSDLSSRDVDHKKRAAGLAGGDGLAGCAMGCGVSVPQGTPPPSAPEQAAERRAPAAVTEKLGDVKAVHSVTPDVVYRMP